MLCHAARHCVHGMGHSEDAHGMIEAEHRILTYPIRQGLQIDAWPYEYGDIMRPHSTQHTSLLLSLTVVNVKAEQSRVYQSFG